MPHLPTSTALGGVSALRRISGDGAVACCFLQQPELSPKGLYPCPRPFASETPFCHCTMGKPLPGCLWVTGNQYLGRLVISVTSDASAAAGAGERDMRILPSQTPVWSQRPGQRHLGRSELCRLGGAWEKAGLLDWQL